MSTDHRNKSKIELSDTADDTNNTADLIVANETSPASSEPQSVSSTPAFPATQPAPSNTDNPHKNKARNRAGFTSGLIFCAILLSAGCAWINHSIGPRIVNMTPVNEFLNMTWQEELAILLKLKFKEARDNFVDPDYKSNMASPILVDLGNFYLGKGDEITAAHYFEECLSQYQRSRRSDVYFEGADYTLDTATDTLSEIYVGQGRYEDAKRVFESRYEGWPLRKISQTEVLEPALDLWLAPTFERAAVFYDKLGDKKRAQQMQKMAEQCRLMPDDLMMERNYIMSGTTRYSPKDAMQTLYLTGRRCAALGEYDKAKHLFRMTSDSLLLSTSQADSQISHFPGASPPTIGRDKKQLALRAQMMLPVVSMLAGDYASAEKEFPAALKAGDELAKEVPPKSDHELVARYWALLLEHQGKMESAKGWRTTADRMRANFDRTQRGLRWWKPINRKAVVTGF